ncbi:Leucine-rich PPR motif-containing protein [Forsythia ovata]|uniref:Leucine-rich PPR motif-containing protein n=1 Tax=Forsythia ovata TaxID=205694 RepID=A0ABD1NXS1_9LAMI
MSSLEIDGYSQSGVGCDKSNILEERVHPLFESYVLPETKQKIDTLISKLDYSSRLKLHGIFIRMKSDLVSSAMRFVKEIQTVFEVSCRDDISAILSCLILRQRRSKLFWTRIPHTSANVERGLMELRKLAIGLESLCKIWDSSNKYKPFAAKQAKFLLDKLKSAQYRDAKLGRFEPVGQSDTESGEDDDGRTKNYLHQLDSSIASFRALALTHLTRSGFPTPNSLETLSSDELS